VDPARHSHPPTPDRVARRVRGRLGLTPGRAALALLAAACSSLSETEAGIATLEIRLPVNLYLEQGRALRLRAVARNKDGDSVAATIVWRTPDTTVALDSATGVITPIDSTGQARIQAAVVGKDLLVSSFGNLVFSLTRRADSLRLAGPDSLTVISDAQASGPLDVRLIRLPDRAPVSGRPITFRIVEPAPSGDTTVVLGSRGVVSDSVLSSATGGPGVGVTVRARTGRRPPDRVVVEAVAYHASGELITGAPRRFVIRFLHQ
jgi:hypothetical protein